MGRKENIEEFSRMAFPEKYFEIAKTEFRDYYLGQTDTLVAAEKAFRNLILLLLKGLDFPEPKVSSRLKERSECIRKFERKYRDRFEQIGTEYSINDHITDLIGVRVICIYESDIEQVAQVLKKHFEVIDITNKTKEIEDTINTFGYKGLHLDLRLSQTRRNLPEYERFADLTFECQVRSIVQDAWSEVDHKLKYKRQTPLEIQRRISNLAALFEMADREFDSIKVLSQQLEAAAVDESTKIDEENTQLELIGFLRVANEHYPNFSLGGESLDGLLADIQSASSTISIAEFRKALSHNLPTVRNYMQYMQTLGHSMAPYTQVRHALYKHNANLFEHMVFQNHRKNFDRWLEYGTVHPAEIKQKK